MKKVLAIFCMAALLLSVLSGCGGQETPTESSPSSEETASVSAVGTNTSTEMFTDRDYEVGYEESSSIAIQLSGTAATASSDSVKISGSTVTITEEGTYLLSGKLTDGQIVVNVPDTAKVQLVLNGVEINSETSAPLYILTGDKVFVTLAENTENILSNGGTFTAIDENNIDGAIFSKQDLTLNGLGSLTVTSPGGHGIVCKDDLVLTSGTYTVTAASHGFDANDSVRIANASMAITAGKDGIHAENSDDPDLGFFYMESGTLEIEAEGDGISSEAYLQLKDGTVNITAGGGSANGTKASSDNYGRFMGGSRGGTLPQGTTTNVAVSADSADTTDESSTSMKGMKSTGNLVISGGTLTVNAADDGIHSNSSVTIDGGTLSIATGDDGIHGDQSLTVNGGTIEISESYEGLEATDLVISGGDIRLTASDDGLNAAGGTDESGITGGRDAKFGGKGGGMASSNGSMVISGGNVVINASGDCLDANGSLSITGGNVTVFGSNVGDSAILDYDATGTISGGTFIGAGGLSMAQNFSSTSTQGVIMVSTGSQSAGSTITLKDEKGNVLLSAEAEQDFSCVILSQEQIVSGGTYTLTAGSYETTLTMDGTIYSSGAAGGMGGMVGKR